MKVFVQHIDVPTDNLALADMTNRGAVHTEWRPIFQHQEIGSGIDLLIALATAKAAQVVCVCVKHDDHIWRLQGAPACAARLGGANDGGGRGGAGGGGTANLGTAGGFRLSTGSGGGDVAGGPSARGGGVAGRSPRAGGGGVVAGSNARGGGVAGGQSTRRGGAAEGLSTGSIDNVLCSHHINAPIPTVQTPDTIPISTLLSIQRAHQKPPSITSPPQLIEATAVAAVAAIARTDHVFAGSIAIDEQRAGAVVLHRCLFLEMEEFLAACIRDAEGSSFVVAIDLGSNLPCTDAPYTCEGAPTRAILPVFSQRSGFKHDSRDNAVLSYY